VLIAGGRRNALVWRLRNHDRATNIPYASRQEIFGSDGHQVFLEAAKGRVAVPFACDVPFTQPA
jgi:hypothetical protein